MIVRRKEEKFMKKLWLLIILLIFCAGCQNNVTPSSQTSGTDWTQYYPMTAGITKKLTDASGKYIDYNVTGSTYTYNNQTLQIIKTVVDVGNGSLESQSLYKVDSNGAYNYGTVTSPTTEAYLLLSFPLEINKTWQADPTTTVTVIKTERLELDLGTYDTYKLSYVTNDGTSTVTDYNWYASGIGLVRKSSSDYDLKLTQKNF